MIEENNRKQPAAAAEKQPEKEQISQPAQQQDDSGESSYAGKLDHVEGQMQHGELGGGLDKEE